jgi:uncharacterized protein with HEPN domain
VKAFCGSCGLSIKSDETVYLRYILDAIAKIEAYIQGVDEKAIRKGTLIQDGVIRQIPTKKRAAKSI